MSSPQVITFLWYLLDRKFINDDPTAPDYPPSVNLLIVVRKDHHHSPFPFDLKINSDVFVDLHRPHMWDRIERFTSMTKLRKHDGWKFAITRNCNHKDADFQNILKIPRDKLFVGFDEVEKRGTNEKYAPHFLDSYANLLNCSSDNRRDGEVTVSRNTVSPTDPV